MRTIILFLLLTSFTYAQTGFRINKKETFNASIVLDPHASMKERGLNIGAAIEYSGTIYTRASITSFAKLHGGYTDLTGAIGLNFTSGYFERIRYYLGGRLGVIKREKNTYPTAGIEAGINVDLGEVVFVGLRGSYDKRGDFKFYGAPAEMRESTSAVIGFKF
jgi:hypothetical protein